MKYILFGLSLLCVMAQAASDLMCIDSALPGAAAESWNLKLAKAVVQSSCGGARESLEHGAQPDTQFLDEESGVDETVLYRAAFNGDTEMIKLLLDAGASVDCLAEENEYTPLIGAALQGNIDAAGLLIQAGANVNAQCTEGTVLAQGVRSENLDLVTLLLSKNATQGADAWGDTELMLAAQEGNVAGLRLLLSQPRFDWRGKNDAELTAYDIARVNERSCAVNLLRQYDYWQAVLQRWEQADTFMPHARTPLDLRKRNRLTQSLIQAVAKKDDCRVQQLLREGAQPDAAVGFGGDQKYRSQLLIVAVMCGHSKTVELLLRYGANKHARDSARYTALMYAIVNKDFESFVHLVAAGSDIDSFDHKSDVPSPVFLAIERNNAIALALLLRMEVDLRKDKYDNTPLMWAARVGNHEAVRMLLPASLNSLSMRNKAGKTAIKIAVNRGHFAIVNLLAAAYNYLLLPARKFRMCGVGQTDSKAFFGSGLTRTAVQEGSSTFSIGSDWSYERVPCENQITIAQVL